MKSRHLRFAFLLVAFTACTGWIPAWPQPQQTSRQPG